MSIEAQVENLAKAAALIDLQDLQGLVALGELFHKLADQIDTQELEVLANVTTSAAELVEQIIMREVDDAEASLARVHQSIEYAQQVIDALNTGRPLSELAPPTGVGAAPLEGLDAPLPQIDEELLGSWVSACSHSLGELEGQLLKIESADDAEELIGEVRRSIHTLKGECGVLSLAVAQKICHEAESLIDRATGGDGAFPVDDMLALVDWMKSYVSALAQDPRAEAPEHEALLQSLSETPGEFAAPAASNPQDPEPCATPEDGQADRSGAVDPAESSVEQTADATSCKEPIEFPPGIEAEENVSDFLSEAREHIAAAEEALLNLEHDFTDAELINTVFRAFHTIKGVAGFMHLDPIVEVAHSAEFLLDGARKGAITLDSSYLDLILCTCDFMLLLIGVIEGAQGPTRGDLADLIGRLQRASKGEREPAASPDDPPSTPKPAHPFPPLGEILVAMHIVKPEQVSEALERQAQGAAKLRDLLVESGLTGVDAVEAELLKNDSSSGRCIHDMLVELGFVTADELNAAIEARRDSDQRIGQLLNVQTKELAPALREQRRQRREEGPAPAAGGEQSEPTADSPRPGPKASASAPAKKKDAAAVKKHTDQNVKVNTMRLDTLVTMVGELVIAQQMVVQDENLQQISDERFKRNLGHSGKIIRDLQEVAMSLRMVTVKATFQKMARLVRDVSSKAGKQIRFHMEGEDTELDRTVVEEIGDPLVHMIRNSCDHGIEPADQRRRAGKPEAGNLTIRAYHQGGSIIIEVQDDGGGLDRDRILAKAVERGIYNPTRDLTEIPDHEVYNLIMLPGFSTAQKVTDISGRGVGLDVVRRNIEALRGTVEIKSTPGKGSTFRMALPLTMAIIDGMVVRVGAQRYVIPTLSIEQSFRPTADQLSTVAGRGEMVLVRGALLPIYRLNRVFNLGEGVDEIGQALLMVLESHDSRCCLLVDEILGQQQVVIKTLGQGINSMRGVSGGAILGDGRVALILDVNGLINEATELAA